MTERPAVSHDEARSSAGDTPDNAYDYHALIRYIAEQRDRDAEIATLRARLASAERVVEAARALVDVAPRCVGPWLDGSGGHRTFGKCDRLAVYAMPDDAAQWACAEHRKSISPGEQEVENAVEALALEGALAAHDAGKGA